MFCSFQDPGSNRHYIPITTTVAFQNREFSLHPTQAVLMMLNNFTLFLLLIIISHHGDNPSIASLCFCQVIAYILLVTLGNTSSKYCSHKN